jgi:hypothetical protein
MEARALRGLLLAAVFATLSVAAAVVPPEGAPPYDLFLRSDYGRVLVWLNTSTGDFRWEDPIRNLALAGKGTLEFPNMGPIILSYAGPMPGYDWVSVSLKIYGTTATGLLAVFPEGEPTRKYVSNFYDKDMRDDVPKPKARPKAPPAPQAPLPKIEGISPAPREVPLPPKP